MRNHRRIAMFAPVLILVVTFAAPTVEAGSGLGLHIGSGGFGVSVGFGDWGVYTRSWSDPYWSIDFNATLAGYGQWVWVNGLGRVWRPWVAASWQPYTHGRWVSTGYGLTWVAYEPWGYVPHHYGSWAYASFGWVWVPGYSYSCANVVWVGSGGYVGWYARPPRGWSHAQHGFRHGYRHGYGDGFGDGYHNGYSDGWHDARYATYVDWRHFGADNVSRHAVTHRIASQDRIVSRANAPTRDEIRQRGGAVVTETRLSRRTVTVDGREVTIARPEGVARSIERNAAETVGRSLSEKALERRQPLVRPRNERESSAASSSRSGGVSRESRSPQGERPARVSTSSRSRQSEVSARSSYEQRPTADSSRLRATAPVSVTESRVEREDARSVHGRSRAAANSGTTNSTRSRSAPNVSSRSHSASSGRQTAQSPRRTSKTQRPQIRTRQSATGSRQSTSAQQRSTESRRSKSQSQTSRNKSEKKEDSERKSENQPRSRRR